MRKRVETEEQKSRRRERKRGYRERDKADPLKWAKILQEKRVDEARRRTARKLELTQSQPLSSNSSGVPRRDSNMFLPVPFTTPALIPASPLNPYNITIPNFDSIPSPTGYTQTSPYLFPVLSNRIRPYLRPSPKTASVDLVSGVLGKQVHSSAALQRWPNNWLSILPTLIQERSGREVNVLERDAKRVKWMADPTNATCPELSVVRYLDQVAYTKNIDLIEDIRTLLSQAKVVVISNSVPSMGRKIENLDDIVYEFGGGFSDGQKVQAHSLAFRAKDPSKPHMNELLNDFMVGVNDITRVEVILDLRTTRESLPAPYTVLDDGRAGWAQSISRYPTDSADPDNFLTSSWALLHHGGVFTNQHQDSEGYNVAIQVAGDRNDPSAKIWGIITFKDPETPKKTRQELAALVLEACQLRRAKGASEDLDEDEVYQLEDPRWSEFCSVELIYVLPGDLVLQPAGTIHLVYTPAFCLSFGSQFYTFDTMHLTEFTRMIHRKHGDFVTNQVHASINETLIRLLLSLPDYNTRVFYKRSIGALCLMVLFWRQYIAKGVDLKQDVTEMKHYKNAAEIAKLTVTTYLGITKPTYSALRLYLFPPGTDYRDPGEAFVLGDQLQRLAGHLFPRDQKNGDDTGESVKNCTTNRRRNKDRNCNVK